MRSFTASIWLGHLLFFLLSNNALSAPTTLNPKIVIIGAGASGIAAAVKLLDDGFEDVTILEAEPRIGGRIHTIPFGDNVVDLGAQWCHGEDNNVVYDIVKDLDILGSSMEIHENSTFHRSNGERISHEISNPLRELLEEIMYKRFHNTLSYKGSTHDFLKEEYFKALERDEYKDIDKTIAAELLEYFEKEECSAEASDDLKDTPLDGDFKYSEGNQALNWKDKGYKSFLNIIMRTAEVNKKYGVLQDHIRLSKKVKSIDWKREDNKAMIKCEDGEEILADHVIVTVSVGVLKEQHNTLFNPALPEQKQAAINAIGFGTVNKIFLEFDRQFWPDYWTGISFLWTDDDLKTIRGTENFWWEGLFGMFAVDSQPRVFELWLIGSSARHVETLDVNKVKNDCIELLKRFLKWDIPEPVNIIKSSWLSNSNFRGSWSYHPMKMIEAGISSNDLVPPLTVVDVETANCADNHSQEKDNHCLKPLVLFAGEASNTDHFATVHGAVETGWREGNRLARFHGA